MGTLADKMLAADKRPLVIDDCARLVDDEVKNKNMIIKMAYKAFTALKPRITQEALEFLVDEFVAVIEPHYDAYVAAGGARTQPIDTYFQANDTRIANDLLGITDRKIEHSKKEVLKKIYKQLRGIAERAVADAAPGIGRLVAKHAG